MASSADDDQPHVVVILAVPGRLLHKELIFTSSDAINLAANLSRVEQLILSKYLELEDEMKADEGLCAINTLCSYSSRQKYFVSFCKIALYKIILLKCHIYKFINRKCVVTAHVGWSQ